MDQVESPKLTHILFNLGNLCMFTKQTKEDIQAKVPYTEVFWCHQPSGHSYGPFESLHAATMHYAWIVAQQKAGKDPNAAVKEADVIFVDFSHKKRIIYE